MEEEAHQDHEVCWLTLGLGFGRHHEYVPKKIPKIDNDDDKQQQFSFTLIPKQELGINNNDDNNNNNMEIDEEDEEDSSEEDVRSNNNKNNNIVNYHQDSSFGSNRRFSDHHHQQFNNIITTNHNYKGISSNNNNNGEGLRERKKLRLSKEQSTLLEESFKLHTTLNPAQKQALAQQLNLKTRQVEVWFQNRRARTKLKQTEVDCQFLKKCCERLNEENRRLKKELNELRSLNKLGASQLYIQLPKAATLTICPSCDKITRSAAANAAALDANSPPQ